MNRTSRRPSSRHLIVFSDPAMRIFSQPKKDGLDSLGRNLAERIIAARQAERKIR